MDWLPLSASWFLHKTFRSDSVISPVNCFATGIIDGTQKSVLTIGLGNLQSWNRPFRGKRKDYDTHTTFWSSCVFSLRTLRKRFWSNLTWCSCVLALWFCEVIVTFSTHRSKSKQFPQPNFPINQNNGNDGIQMFVFSPSPQKNVVWYSQEFVLIFLFRQKTDWWKMCFVRIGPLPFFHIHAPENPVFLQYVFFLPSPWKSAFDYSSKWWGSLLLDNDKPSWTKLLKNGGAPRFFQGTPRSFFQLSPEKWWHLKEADPASEFWMIYFATGRAVKLRSMQFHSMISVDRWHAAPITDFFSLRNGSTGMNSWWGIHPVNQRDPY